MSEPKLLTEAEVRGYFKHNPCADVAAIIESFRERGLIAPEPEPVDPVRLMAVQIMDYLNPQGDEWDISWVVNTILRPGIDALELAERPTLTREMVEEMTFPACDAAYREVYCDLVPEVQTPYVKAFARHFHAALTEALK